MGKGKTAKSESARQKRLMKKRSKDIVRHKTHTSGVMTENTIQHQMLGEFGSVQNFIKNVRVLAEMFGEEESLKSLRFDAKAIYDKIDLEDPEANAALKDLFEAREDITAYGEDFEPFWKDTRTGILPDFLTDEFVDEVARRFKVLLARKRGFKREYRAVLAGNLLVQAHKVALAESPVGENNLWELIFNATLKENPVDLPEPRAVSASADDAGDEESAGEGANESSGAEAAGTASSESEE
ncbi:hypothetical protein K8I61_16025 [bacterium]|nr:hypothetical protein [bacterium]